MSLGFSDVGYIYGDGTAYATRALGGVTLELPRTGLTLVLGATGSGKSTLLRLAAGLLLPTTGSLTYDGAPVTGPLATAARPVGLVFQSPETQLFAETVIEDVAFAPRNRGRAASESRAAAERALRTVGLDPASFADRSPFSLSGGEARRVAIAGVLAMEPATLLFDEPTAGLDASGRRAVREVVASARRDAGVVVVTHDAEEFLGVADRAVLLKDGAVTFDGPAATLVGEPDRFAEAGLRMPEVLRAQVLAREAGFPVERFSADPAEAAALLGDARGASR